MIDSQSVKTTELGGDPRGYDVGKQVGGRKRYIAVDVIGLILGVAVTSASAVAGNAASEMLWQLDDAKKFPRLKGVDADQKCENATVKEWLAARGDPFRLDVVRRPEDQEGFVKSPKRWVVERNLAWLGDREEVTRCNHGVKFRESGRDNVSHYRISSTSQSEPCRATTKPIGISKTITKQKILMLAY